MDWKVFVLAIVGVGLLIASFFIGGKMLQKPCGEGLTIIQDTTVVDTLYVIDTIKVTQIKTIKITTEGKKRIFRDTLTGLERNISYRVEQESILDKDSVHNTLAVEFKPLMMQILTNKYKYVEKPHLIYVDVFEPFYKNEWFWTTFILAILTLIMSLNMG